MMLLMLLIMMMFMMKLSIDIECYRYPLQDGSCPVKGMSVCVGACTIDADAVFRTSTG